MKNITLKEHKENCCGRHGCWYEGNCYYRDEDHSNPDCQPCDEEWQNTRYFTEVSYEE